MYEYAAKVLKVVDGETLDLEVDLGFYVKIEVKVRLHGISKPKDYQKGMDAVECINGWLEDNAIMLADASEQVLIKVHDGLDLASGDHGRWIAEVWSLSPLIKSCLNYHLIEEGHAEKLEYR